ncbi:hypothetical protein [Micromonospora fluostatini]|uniref:hypothetical protein n=1 Tax=Micromonospora sp. JCM 30529 TaxID=3421643 RepID=UPI003D182436
MATFSTTSKTVRFGVMAAVTAVALTVGGSASGGARLATSERLAPAAGACDRNLGTAARTPAAPGVCRAAGTPELIWQGHIHLGDEPGIYGDALYSGLSTEIPITLERTSTSGPERTTLVLETEDVQTFEGYPGHQVTVYLHVPDPDQPFHSDQVVLTRTRLTSADNNRKEIRVNLAGRQSPYHVSVQIRQDTEVPAGALDDFQVTRLSNVATDFGYIASYGFTPPPVN